MDNKKMMALSDDALDNISGGSLGYDPDGKGTYTMHCQYTGQVFHGVKLEDIMKIAQYSAYIDDNLDGENQIIAWALSQGYIH